MQWNKQHHLTRPKETAPQRAGCFISINSFYWQGVSLYHKLPFVPQSPLPQQGGGQSLQSRDNEARQKMKQNKPDGRCATCPRWDRWHIRIPNPKDQQKLIELYRRSGTKTKSDFLRAQLLDESFKVIIEDESAEECYRKLSSITARIQKIGILYNQTVRAINSYHTVKAAQVMLQRLEQFSQQIITLEQQAIELTWEYQKR